MVVWLERDYTNTSVERIRRERERESGMVKAINIKSWTMWVNSSKECKVTKEQINSKEIKLQWKGGEFIIFIKPTDYHSQWNSITRSDSNNILVLK